MESHRLKMVNPEGPETTKLWRYNGQHADIMGI